jgi:hypothetical protein
VAFGSALWVINAYSTLPGFTGYFLAAATLAAAIPLALVLWLVFHRRGGLGTAYLVVLFAVGGFLTGFSLVIGLGTDAGPRQLLNALLFLALAYGAGGAFMAFLIDRLLRWRYGIRVFGIKEERMTMMNHGEG